MVPSSPAGLCNEVDELTELTTFTLNSCSLPIDALSQDNPLDTFDFSEHSTPLNLADEQDKDPDLLTVKNWIRDSTPVNLLHTNLSLKKYLKQLPRLTLNEYMLYRKFFDQTGNHYHLQICVPTHLRQELLHRFHNSHFKSHNGIAKTVHDLRLKFYFPNYHEEITRYVNNCMTC